MKQFLQLGIPRRCKSEPVLAAPRRKEPRHEFSAQKTHNFAQSSDRSLLAAADEFFDGAKKQGLNYFSGLSHRRHAQERTRRDEPRYFAIKSCDAGGRTTAAARRRVGQTRLRLHARPWEHRRP